MAIPAALLLAQAGTSLFSAKLASDAAKQEARALEFQAENESINARIRNNERTERLLDAIAANNAAAGARGVSAFSGSPLTILEQNIKKTNRRSIADFENAKLNELSLRSRSFATRRSAQIKAFGSLLGTGADIAKTGG